MNRLASENLKDFENHLLACPACQIRLTEFDEFIAAIRPALRSFQGKKAGLPLFERNVFISHGGYSTIHVEKVCELLDEVGLKPVVSIYMPNLGLPPKLGGPGQMWSMRSACCRQCRISVTGSCT